MVIHFTALSNLATTVFLSNISLIKRKLKGRTGKRDLEERIFKMIFGFKKTIYDH